MKSVSISGSPRENVGKKDAKKHRNEGKVPCVLYGGKEQIHFIIVKKTEKINDYYAPVCAFAIVDLGIAIGSASKMAQFLNLDNRVMYSIGATAVEMCLIEGDIVMGIPLSVSSKNIYFDR